jgi:type VI secretion system protein VasJ
MIGPPNGAVTSQVEAVRAKGDAKATLRAAEEAFSSAPLWLDLQRITVEAADGAALPAVAEAVIDELAALVRRCPDLATLTFSDGTPLADAATQLWLANRVATAEGGDSASSGGHVGSGDDPLAESATEVTKRLGKGDLEGALAALRDGASQDRTARDRFRRHLKMAEVCLKGGKPAVAVPFLDRLVEEVERHGLGMWDPELASEVWTLLYTGCTALVAGAADADKPALQEKARVAYERVCQIDPARALPLAPKR